LRNSDRHSSRTADGELFYSAGSGPTESKLLSVDQKAAEFAVSRRPGKHSDQPLWILLSRGLAADQLPAYLSPVAAWTQN